MTERRPALALMAVAAAACAGPRAQPPSVVVVLVDTLRQDHLAAYGYARETAPTLTRLAREGAILDGLSVTSWTKPAVASLFTGLHPLRHQVVAGEALSMAATTLAEVLKRRGYRTLGVSANAQVSGPFGFAQGFDDLVLVGGGFPPAGKVNEQLLPRLEGLRPPFFLYLHYVDPHGPYEPTVAWDGSPLDPALAARLPLDDARLEPRRFTPRPPKLVADAVDLYDGEVRRADQAIAEVLGALERRGLLRSAVTVVVADHGEEFEDHGRMGHGLSLYGEVVRVPMIVHAPGLVAAGARHGTASLLDVLPTILELAGVAEKDLDVDGVSLAPFLRSGERYDDPGREHLLHLDVPAAAALALVTRGHKLYLSRSPHRKELFALGEDARERRDRAGLAEAAPLLRDLAHRLADRHNELADQALSPAAATPSAELKEALAAVGYLSPPGGQPRSIPRRIAAMDPRAEGLLGWEEVSSCQPCVRTASAEAASQLLDGWYAVELGGRWTWPAASALLGWPRDGSARLVLEGVNHELQPVRVRITVGEHVGADQEVLPGRFTVRCAAGSGRAGVAVVVRIEREDAFVPRQHGLSDDRTLGVFVTSACLVPGD